MPSSVTPKDLQARAQSLWARHGRRWAAGDHSTAHLDIPLHPPTEAAVLADYDGARRWTESWRENDGGPIHITWQLRNWGRVGTNEIPVRARVDGPDNVAVLAGTQVQWRQWRDRAAELRDTLGETAELSDALAAHMRHVGDLDHTDFARFRDTARWLRSNPPRNVFIRTLPIRGIDSKWLERHREAIEALAGGRLPLRRPDALARLRFLDPQFAPAGMRDVAAPHADWDRLDLAPSHVLIVENLQTFLALPDWPGVIAVDGRGNSAPGLAQIGWMRATTIVYWGDLDSHGFRILSQTRLAGLDAQSCLMDVDTLLAHRDLWVPEPSPHIGAITQLTEAEARALTALREYGHVRLEQERISWDYALQQVSSVL